MSILGDAQADCAIKILQRIIADAGFGIRRDVGRIDHPHRGAHLQSARKSFAALTEWQATQSPARARYSPLLVVVPVCCACEGELVPARNRVRARILYRLIIILNNS